MMKANHHPLNAKVTNTLHTRKLSNSGKHECSTISFYNTLIRRKFGILLSDIGREWSEAKVNRKK